MTISTKPTISRMSPMVHKMEILSRNPATRRMIPRMIMAFTSFRCRCGGTDKRDQTWSQPMSALSTRAAGSVFAGVFDFVPCLFGVALELIDASLGAQPGVAGGAAEVLLGGALGGFGLVGDLLTDTHCGLLRSR